MFRTYAIPLSEVGWFEERLTRGSGRVPSMIEIRAQHGDRSVRLDAATAHPDSADEFQEPLIEILQHLAPKHGYRLELINLTDG